jgi:peptide/nickel transport system substrate-binding protein
MKYIDRQMKSKLFATRLLHRFCAFISLGLVCAACAIEGGVPNRTAVPTAPAPGRPPTDAAIAAANAERDDTWVIGLLDQPRYLTPYQSSQGNQRLAAPVTELLFPSPVLAYNYTYSNTGVLDRLPTLENGDAELRKADVYLDEAGSITTTVTQVVTQVDQLVVTFHWNPKLRWSDGQPVTADDSVFAYELAKAAPPSPEASDRLAQIALYERVDEHTTRAVLQPDFTTPTYFLNYWTPLPRHVLKDHSPGDIFAGDFARKPIGYGPYAIESRSDREIAMVRNQHYFGPPPAATHLKITFQPSFDVMRAGLLNGNLDLVASDRLQTEVLHTLDQDQRDRALQVSYISNPNWEHIDFNLDVPEFQDIRVRRAIALGANRQAMTDALSGGHSPVLDSWVLPSQLEAAPADQITRYNYDLDAARKLLDEAGYVSQEANGIRASPNGITLTFTLLTTDGTPIRQQIAQMFKQDMKALGIDIQIQALPGEQLFAPDGPLFQRQFDLALFGWIANPDPGGLLLWSCNAIPSLDNNWSGDNFAGWCFRDASRAIREAVTTLDVDKRKAAYLRQQQLWTQELPSLPLFQRLSLTLAVPSVRGIRPDALAPITWNIAQWRRAKS